MPRREGSGRKKLDDPKIKRKVVIKVKNKLK